MIEMLTFEVGSENLPWSRTGDESGFAHKGDSETPLDQPNSQINIKNK